ncbi:MAG: response regulator [Gammaproteobacteria bacterium]|nr:response regulator [Gammaproteobacteria bacterium]
MTLNFNPELLQARILIVDDQPANVMLLEKMLSSAGFAEVDSTTDSRLVTEMYEQKKYDLVLLDISMPFMNGFDVMEALRDIERESYVPVLVLTAQTDRDTRIKSLELGAKDFLTKPFDRLEVLTRIRNMLDVRLLHNQVRDQNKVLEQKVRERTQEVNETRLEVIRRLGRAAEYRDNETGLHIIRMSKYSQRIASATGMTDVEAEDILNASPMHDIGKIGIPDSILLKPGKLDAQEWEIMQTHTNIGAEILSGHTSSLMQMAREIAISHHEKWDGSGYPNKLAGDNIPLTGRIVAIADVFDALTTERPYKEAWSVDDAMNLLQEQRGKHFQPDLVDLFSDILDDILDIRAQHMEPGATA